jgi:hypothetical protein
MRGEGCGRRGRVEVELDQLPVALVQVVEVVVDVEEPVLERELPRLRRDVGIDGRRAPRGDLPLPRLVRARRRGEGVSREVERVALVVGCDVGRAGRDLGEAGGPAKRDVVVAEDGIDVDRLERLSACARRLLFREPDDGRVARGELMERVSGSGRRCQRVGEARGREDGGGEDAAAHGSNHDAGPRGRLAARSRAPVGPGARRRAAGSRLLALLATR